MRQAGYLFAWIALALVGGALLAYPLFLITQPFLSLPHGKIANYATLACGFLIAMLYLRQAGALDRAGWGLRPSGTAGRDLIAGLAAGLVIMALYALLLLALGIHMPEPDRALSLSGFLAVLGRALLAAAFAATLEELLFRGALFSGLERSTNTLAAILLTSLLYAAVHFIQYPATAPAVLTWYSALLELPAALAPLADPARFDHLLTLFVLGTLLALARLRRGNILPCIGLHAGLIIALKLTGYFTDYAPDSRLAILVNPRDHTLGWLSFAWLTALTLGYWRWQFHPARR